jgi:hypothetical protein
VRFCGARCERSDAATLRTDFGVEGLRRTFEAIFATGALVLRFAGIAYTPIFSRFLYPRWRREINRHDFWFLNPPHR